MKTRFTLSNSKMAYIPAFLYLQFLLKVTFFLKGFPSILAIFFCSVVIRLTFCPAGDNFFVHNEADTNPSSTKELNISTLRRKLFSQADPSPAKDIDEIDINDNQRPE